jgi:hypothetical protein
MKNIQKGSVVKKEFVATLLGCREFDMKETLALLKQCGGSEFWTWGANQFTNYGHKVLGFKVTGLKHNGNVYIALNSSDLYDVVLTTSHGTVKDMSTDLYFDQLFDVMHHMIEIDMF